MQASEYGGEKQANSKLSISVVVSQIGCSIPTFLPNAKQKYHTANANKMIGTYAVLQSSGALLANITEGEALLYVGTFIGLTLIAMKLKSMISLFTWMIAGVMLVLAIVGIVSVPFYWGTLALSMIGSVASAIYTVNNV